MLKENAKGEPLCVCFCKIGGNKIEIVFSIMGCAMSRIPFKRVSGFAKGGFP